MKVGIKLLAGLKSFAEASNWLWLVLANYIALAVKNGNSAEALILRDHLMGQFSVTNRTLVPDTS